METTEDDELDFQAEMKAVDRRMGPGVFDAIILGDHEKAELLHKKHTEKLAKKAKKLKKKYEKKWNRDKNLREKYNNFDEYALVAIKEKLGLADFE